MVRQVPPTMDNKPPHQLKAEPSAQSGPENHINNIATYLYDNEILSVGRMAAGLGLSAAAVQQGLAELSARGCILETSPQTVALQATGWPFWRFILEKACSRSSRQLGRNTLVFESIGSTNDVCLQAAGRMANNRQPLVVLADRQTRGRGRWGRNWTADAGQSVLMSVLLPDAALSAETLTLAAGVACAAAVERRTGCTVSLKWPNDLLIDGRKLAGILIETVPGRVEEPATRKFVLGLGLNVNQQSADFPPELSQRATSLRLATGQAWDRLSIIDALLSELDAIAGADAAPAVIANAWKTRSQLLGQTVRVRCRGREIPGQIADVDPLAGLVVRDHAGAIHFCPAAETTLLTE